jgi:hypothetical protein
MPPGQGLLVGALTLLLSASSLHSVPLGDEVHKLLYFSRQRGGACALKSWDPKSKVTVVLAARSSCPNAVYEQYQWDESTSGERVFTFTVLALGTHSLERITLNAQGAVLSQNTVHFPSAWPPGVVASEAFGIGRFRDTHNLGAAIMTRPASNTCAFEYHEFRDGRWFFGARPEKACSYGESGGPRFGFESGFESAEAVMSRGDITVESASTPKEPLRWDDNPYAIGGGTAAEISPGRFKLGPNVREGEGGWYYLRFLFADAPVLLFYCLEAEDWVYVTDLYLQPARSALPRRISRDSSKPYPTIAGRFLLVDSQVIDMVTGRLALKEPTLMPFWHRVSRPNQP